MSLYNLLPPPSEFNLHSWWDNGFSADELMAITKKGEEKRPADSIVGVGEGRTDPTIRRSRVSWLSQADIPWLYDRLGWIARQLNGQYFHWDVTGFSEDLQYTVYDSTDQGAYDWHMDGSPTLGVNGGAPVRKMSMVLMLSDPSEYEGGELHLQTGNGTVVADPAQGKVHVFPSFLLHRVTPVTKGTRRSLVVWLVGPAWR